MSIDPVGGGNLTSTELYEEYNDQLHRYAMGLTRDSNRANDLPGDFYPSNDPP